MINIHNNHSINQMKNITRTNKIKKKNWIMKMKIIKGRILKEVKD